MQVHVVNRETTTCMCVWKCQDYLREKDSCYNKRDIRDQEEHQRTHTHWRLETGGLLCLNSLKHTLIWSLDQKNIHMIDHRAPVNWNRFINIRPYNWLRHQFYSHSSLSTLITWNKTNLQEIIWRIAFSRFFFININNQSSLALFLHLHLLIETHTYSATLPD